jgi:hypothetical protein
VKLFGVRINFFRFYYYLFSSTVIYSWWKTKLDNCSFSSSYRTYWSFTI